jgi:predicted NBD/HSP70 family sugar kinase
MCHCEDPLSHWTLGLESWAVVFEAADLLDAWGQERGGRTGLGLDVSFEDDGTGGGLPIEDGYWRGGRLWGEILTGSGDDLATLAADTITAAAGDGLRVVGVAVAVPGLVADGVVRLAPNLDWRDVPLAAALTERAGRIGVALDEQTLTIDNEANLAALAELHASPEPRPSFLYISGEIGVGAGIVLEGRLLRGARGYGGELGHVTIRPDGVPCRCGARGCLEAYANQEVLLRGAGLDPDDPTEAVTRLVALARAGAHPALMTLEEVGSAIGVAAADVVNLLDLDTVVLGGVYAPLAPWLIEPVTREVTERTITSGWAPVTVRASALGTAATVLGAAGSIILGIGDARGPGLPRLTV